MLITWVAMTEENQTAIPAEVVATESEASKVEQQEGAETTAEQSQDTEQTQKEEATKKEPWFQKRISEVTREKYEAKRAAEQAINETHQLREQIARLQNGEQYEPPAQDVHTLAERRAQELVAERVFNENCNKVYDAGKTEFPDFDQAVANLQMTGATANRNFLELVATSDAGAKLLHHLASDLDEAARIAALPPVQMARELTKLDLKLAQPRTKAVSKAPAPITAISSGKADSKDPATMSDAEFAAWRRKQISQRR